MRLKKGQVHTVVIGALEGDEYSNLRRRENDGEIEIMSIKRSRDKNIVKYYVRVFLRR